MPLSYLSRSWIIPCTIGSIIYFLLQTIMIIVHIYSSSSSCNLTNFKKWTWIPNLVESIFFSALVILLANRVAFTNGISSDVGCLFTTIFISTLAGITSFLNLLTDWAGICEDAFGIKLPGAIWAEWIVCVPILYYIVLATSNIKKLANADKIVLLLMTGVFVCSIGMQFTKSYPLSLFLLIMTFSLYSGATILFYHITIYTENRVQPDPENPKNTEYDKCLRKTKVTLSACLLCVSILFPIIYFMTLLRIIDQDTAYAFFICSNIISKFFFISMANNSYISIDSEFSRIKLSTEVTALHSATIGNQTRRLFLRYIMHEVRVPLNSISMGLGYLEQNPNIDDDAREALLMMCSASECMKQTLDEVLNLQSIEEGTMQLAFSPFTIHSVIRKVRASVVNILKEKQILLDIHVHPAVPKWIVGDAARIEVVLTVILNNALKFSNVQSFVGLEVSSDKLSKRKGSSAHEEIRSTTNTLKFDTTGKSIFISKKLTSTVTFTILDHGPGIPPEDLPYLFIPFAQVRPHELQTERHGEGSGEGEGKGGKRSSGVGLVMCKQIVELHGGTISCRSTLGVGSTFTFSIPFALCDDAQGQKSEHKSSYNTRLHRNRSLHRNSSSSNINSSFREQTSGKTDMPRIAESTCSQSSGGSDTNHNSMRRISIDPGGSVRETSINSSTYSSFSRPSFQRVRSFDTSVSGNVSGDGTICVSARRPSYITTTNNGSLLDVEKPPNTVEVPLFRQSFGMTRSSSSSISSQRNYRGSVTFPMPATTTSTSGTSSSSTVNALFRTTGSEGRGFQDTSRGICSVSAPPPVIHQVLSQETDVGMDLDTDMDTEVRVAAAVVPVVATAAASKLLPAVGSVASGSGNMAVSCPDNRLMHVLVTDDVSSNRKLLAMLLRRRGVASTMASNGREAVELVEHAGESYDMIFMDNSMPVMSGVEATKAIRAAGYPNLIIGVTGNAMADDVAAFIAAGADAVILKPLSVHQLQQILEYVSVFGKAHSVNRRLVFHGDHWECSDI